MDLGSIGWDNYYGYGLINAEKLLKYVTQGVFVPVTNVSLNKTNLMINIGAHDSLSATIAPITATNKDVTWSSNNTAVATVDSNGKVVGVNVGTAVITVTTVDGSKSATCTVTISPPIILVTGVSLNKNSLVIMVGDNDTLSATVAPANATDKYVYWYSDNSSVATVDNNGNVVGVSDGTAIITVQTFDGFKTATCAVTVSRSYIPVTNVSLNKTSSMIDVGNSDSLSATIAPTTATNKNVTWSSSNTVVATVDSNGKVVGVRAGSAVIAIRTVDGSKTATCTVTVTGTAPVPNRLSGNAAEQTAVAIADQTGWTGTAILASSTSYGMVDALTAGPLSLYLKAPILLTGAENRLDAATKAELVKLSVTKVYVASRTAVIRSAVLAELSAMNITVIPLGGYDRSATSVNIARQMVGVTKVAVANGVQDALSIAAIASASNEPILLTEKNELPTSVRDYLVANPGITASDVIGGTGIISNAVKATLPNATRHAGYSAYDTNNQVIQDFVASLKFDQVYVANGVTGIDALAGAPLAAQTKSAIVLTDEDDRQAMDPGEVHRLMDLSLVARPLAEGGHGDHVIATHPRCHRDADRVEHLGPHR